jgi:hypothetical protein
MRRDRDGAWRAGFERAFAAFARFRRAFEAATGEAALSDEVGTAFGCGQHIKLHARLQTSHTGHKSSGIDALRNFRRGVVEWRRRLARARRGCEHAAAASEALDELGRVAHAWLPSLLL